MRYEVKKDGKSLKVFDTKDNTWITKPLPSMEIANEICDDFNKMDNKDYSPIGLPNFSAGGKN